MKYITIGLCGLIICAATMIIANIRKKRVSDDSAIGAIQNEDILDVVMNWKRRDLKKNPWNMAYETYTAIATTCASLFAIVVYIMTANILFAAFAGVLGVFVPELIIKLQNSSQKSNFEERYARGLRQLAAGLKTGLSIHQSVNEVANSPFVHDSVRKEFQMLSAELQLSISIQDAFDNFAERVKCQDAKDVAIAIGLQAKIGGREAEVIEGIAGNISERLMLRKEIASLFAGSNATIVVMDFLPFVVIAFMLVATPDYMGMYFQSSLMMVILIVILIIMAIGSVVIHRVVTKMRRDCGV